MSKLTVGSPAPDFTAQDQNGKTHALADYAGKMVVLYFYPKDDTPGCTKEACSFRDLSAEYAKKNVVVLGVSPDDTASHEKFARKFELNFPLLADTEKKIAEAYEVWVEKSMYGKQYMGVERSTFVIGPDGNLSQVLRKVKAETHPGELLESL